MQTLHANKCKNELRDESVWINYIWLSICISFIFIVCKSDSVLSSLLDGILGGNENNPLGSLSYHKDEIQVHWTKCYDSVYLSWQCLLVIVYYVTPS